MKTIYLFILILAFSMASSYAFACEGGGEGGGASNSSVSTVPTGALSAAPAISFYTNPNAVQCSSNISVTNCVNTDRTHKHRTNEKIDAIIAYLRLKIISGGRPGDIEKFNKSVSAYGKRYAAKHYLLFILVNITPWK